MGAVEPEDGYEVNQSTSQLYDSGDAVGGGRITTDPATRMTTITLHGEVDAAIGGCLDALQEQATAAGLPVRVDVRTVSFMNSTGIRFLIRLAKGRAPARVQVIGPGAQVRHLLSISRLSDVLDIVAS